MAFSTEVTTRTAVWIECLKPRLTDPWLSSVVNKGTIAVEDDIYDILLKATWGHLRLTVLVVSSIFGEAWYFEDCEK